MALGCARRAQAPLTCTLGRAAIQRARIGKVLIAAAIAAAIGLQGCGGGSSSIRLAPLPAPPATPVIDDTGEDSTDDTGGDPVDDTGRDPVDNGICGRTEQVRTAILALIVGIDTCGAVTDAHLAAITGKLNLARSSLSSLQAGDFSGLSNLTSLDLDNNELETLPTGILTELTSLQYLSIEFNQLRGLPAGLLTGLTDLRAVRFLMNRLESLPANTFAGLNRLTVLDLEYNDLRTLPAGVFAGLELTFLGLEANDLQTLEAEFFSGLAVEKLDLSHNDTRTIASNAFGGIRGLEYLDLGYNQLDALPAGVLDGVTTLSALLLEENPGADFTFTMNVERRPGTNRVVVTVPEGAPFDMTTTISATGGTLPDGVSSVTVPTGHTRSGEIAVSPLEGATVSLGPAPAVPSEIIGFGGIRFNGVSTAVSGPVTFSTPATTNTPATGRPAINGTAQVGETLTASLSEVADADGIESTTFFYQWLSDEADIEGGTDATYTLTAAEEGKKIKVRVTFTDDGGTGETLVSTATGAVTARGKLSVADAEASEEEDAALAFVVTLDPAAMSSVTVDYATANGTATAGEDYSAASGTLTFEPGDTTKTVSVQISDDAEDDDGETLTLSLSNASGADLGDAEATGTIRNSETPQPDPLTASFTSVPEAHDGESAFNFQVEFSEDVDTLSDDSFTVNEGEVTGTQEVGGRSDLWKVTVEPDSDDAVTVTLPGNRACNTSGAICTGDGRPLSNSPAATVAGPAGLSVADATAEENTDTTIDFTVTLDRAASGTVTVDYETADGTATAGSDYTAASGTLSFAAGERTKTVSVTLLDDTHDEGEETFTLTLSNASGAVIADGEATGTIENHDPMPRALLARFGRTAAVHVVEHVEERLQASREPGFRGRFAGQELRRGMERETALNFLSQLGAAAEPAGGLNGHASLGMGLDDGNLLTGSSFVMNHETRRGGTLSFWSRGAQSRFAGRDGQLSLGGRVRTTMFGADYAKGPLITGLSLSHSRGLGGYTGVDVGEVTSSVTGLYPWLGYKVTDRITLWGVTGYGKGALRLTPGAGTALRSGLSMAMTAGGMRGELADSVVGGFGLAFKADALWVGTGIEGVDGPQGRLAATSAAVTRTGRRWRPRAAIASSAGCRSSPAWRWECGATAGTPRTARAWTSAEA